MYTSNQPTVRASPVAWITEESQPCRVRKKAHCKLFFEKYKVYMRLFESCLCSNQHGSQSYPAGMSIYSIPSETIFHPAENHPGGEGANSIGIR